MANDKFDSMLDKATEKIGKKTSIDFKESDIDNGGSRNKTFEVPPKGKLKTVAKKKIPLTVYLTESENEAFLSSFKPFERKSEKIRELILEYIRKEEKK